MVTKTCRGCREEKLLEAFRANLTQCKSCQRKELAQSGLRRHHVLKRKAAMLFLEPRPYCPCLPNAVLSEYGSDNSE